MLLLAGLLLEPLELLDLRLHRLVEQPLLEVVRDLDRVDAELALVVELDDRVPRGARGLLVGGEERVLQSLDDGVLLDPLLALQPTDVLDDLLRHRSYAPSSTR